MPRSEVSKDFMPVSEAAKHLGLERSLLVWAAGDGLLSGQQDEKGNWYLDRKSIESGQLPLESQFPHLADKAPANRLPKRVSESKQNRPKQYDQKQNNRQQDGWQPDAIDETTENLGKQDLEAPPSPRVSDAQSEDLLQEIIGLKSQLRSRDELVADLARSLARIGESMAGQLGGGPGLKGDKD